MKQTVSMLIIDKKRMKIKDSGLPQMVIDQTPKYMRWTKLPVVKAKVGPQIMSLVCDEKIFESVPVKKEVKAVVSGIYVLEVKGLHGKAPVKEEKKPSANETVYYRSKQQKSEDAKRRNRIKAIEQEISDADERLAQIEQEMAEPETCADYEKMSALCAEMEELKNRQNDLMDEWAELSEELS